MEKPVFGGEISARRLIGLQCIANASKHPDQY